MHGGYRAGVKNQNHTEYQVYEAANSHGSQTFDKN